MDGFSTTARGTKEPRSLEESELLREEEEMLAITKMLKSIDGKDSFVMAKQILQSKGPAISPSMEASTEASTNAEADIGYPTIIGNGVTELVLAPEMPIVSSPSAPQASTGSRLSSGISPSTPPDSGKSLEIAIQTHSPSPSPSPPSLLQPEVNETETEVEHIHDTQGQVPNIRQQDETTPDLCESKQKDEHISSEIAVVGRTVITASKTFPAPTSISQPEVGELTVANMQRQNDAFDQQVQDPNVQQAWYTNSFAPSTIATSSSHRLASQLPGSSEGPETSDKPVSVRKQPGTTRSGRVWTAPPKRVIESSDEEPTTPKPAKRRPGRPRGYYLGPISCAFCRQQHRRCDYNVVCNRCLKAGIPCDRDGTVARPSILVLQAKVAAKAQAEADRKAMIAAGLAPPKRYRPQKPRSESDEYQCTKRRRSQSPRGGFSQENIMERAKRKTRPVKKYDPAEDLSAKEYRELQKRLGLEGAAQVDKEQEDFTPQRQLNITTEVSVRLESTSVEMESEVQGETTLERPDTPVTSNASEASLYHNIPSSFQEDHIEIDYLESENFGEGSSTAHLSPPPPPLLALTPTPAVPPKVKKTLRSSTVTKETKISKPAAPATPNLAMISATPKLTTKKTIPPATSTLTARRATPKRSVTRHESAIASFAVDPADLSSGVNSDQSTPEPPMADQAVVVSKKTGVSISLLAGVSTQDVGLDSVTPAVDEIRNPKRRPGRPPGSKFTRQQTALTPANQVAFLRGQISQPFSPTPNVFQPGVMRRPGRPPWKGNYTPEPHIISLGPDKEPIIRRGVGRPPNVVRQAIALEKRRQMQERATINNQPAVATAYIAVSLEEDLVKKSVSSSSSESIFDEESDARTKSTRIIKERVAKTSLKRINMAPTDKQTSVGKADHVKATRAKPPVVTTAPKPAITMKEIRVSSEVEPVKPTAVAKLTRKTHRSKVVSRESTADEDSESSRGTPTPTKSTIRLVRKTYLKSGLYSSELKVDQPSTMTEVVKLPTSAITALKNQAVQALGCGTRRTETLQLPLHRKSTAFPLPIHYGADLMAIKRDFILPFDIMQAWRVGLLQQPKQPEPFIKIRSNIFVERKRRTENSPMVCHCKPPSPGAGRVGCGEDCYNRVMFYECVSAFCPCGDQCSNQRLQMKHNTDHLRVIWTEERGFGIQTLEPIKRGNLVIEYRGEVISQNLSLERMEGIYKNNKNFYFLEYEKGEVVDACRKGTNARFVNHSQIEKWFLNGEMSIGIFASQDIPAGAEISYDYNFSSFQGAQKQVCRCGAPNCRGYIGERVSKTKETAVVTIKKNESRKHKAGRRKLDTEMPSVRFGQMPTVGQIRQRQSDKYKLGKMIAIRFTRLFLFRNIQEVESKYVRYAQTKSRSNQENVGLKIRQIQARQCRKRRLEGVIEDLRANTAEEEDAAQE
ncbi:Histone-Lysine N-Methyltransferase ash1l [Haplosporangium bisporale]|nr:Histone-Lysine N-Methyltransferase ash1l [Haplosporangium bisporale]